MYFKSKKKKGKKGCKKTPSSNKPRKQKTFGLSQWEFYTLTNTLLKIRGKNTIKA